MKAARITLIAFITLVIGACSTAKEGTTSGSPVKPSHTNKETMPSLLPKPAGIHAPGEEELAAIQVRYREATLDQLKTGHAIYTQGSCINCHGAMNIYKYTEVQWTSIIDDMALRARISDADKDAVYKYVLAMKATQPK
jgi:mono/diheme cytochrome c family protein